MDNVWIDDASEEGDNANFEANDVKGDENQGTESENDEPAPPPNRKKRATNVDEDGKDHDGF